MTMKQRKKPGGADIELHSKVDDMALSVTKLATMFEAHLKQDEQFYQEVKKIAERLGEYNTQLQIHIAGVQELKGMHQVAREERDILRKDYEQRLKALELKSAHEDGSKSAHSTFREKLKVSMTVIGTVCTLGGAFIAILKFLFHVV